MPRIRLERTQAGERPLNDYQGMIPDDSSEPPARPRDVLDRTVLGYGDGLNRNFQFALRFMF